MHGQGCDCGYTGWLLLDVDGHSISTSGPDSKGIRNALGVNNPMAASCNAPQ